MLHAELRNKLTSDIGDGVERGEDVMTSTVFGTLFTAGAWDVVIEWLSRARRGGAAAAIDSGLGPNDYWFWPRLDNAEPDVVLQLGTTLVVVEAKYLSKKSGPSTTAEPGAKPTDQLVREWHAIASTANVYAYEPRLRALVAEPGTPRMLIYLVCRSSSANASEELDESLAQAPDAGMYLLTWEDLDEVLATRLQLRWADELHRYLGVRRVAAFRSYRRAFSSSPSRALRTWGRYSRAIYPSFANTMSLQPAIALLARRAPRFTPARGWTRAFRAESSPLVRHLANRPHRFPEH